MTGTSVLILGAAIFLAGVVSGMGMVAFGFQLGFKASREIRMFKDPESVDLLPSKKDPPEFALADQQEKDDIDDDNKGPK